MSALSDQLLIVTLLAYAIAMVAFAAGHALAAPLPAPADVAAGAAAVALLQRPTPPRRAARLARGAGAGMTIVAAAAQAGTVIIRGLAADRVPWGNMYEFILVVSLVGVLAWLTLAAVRPAVRPLGLYVSLSAVVLLGAGAMRVYTQAARWCRR